MLVGGGATMAMRWVVGGEIVVSTLTWENFQLLQRKFNRKTPNIYIANIVNKIGLLWKSF